MMWQKALVGAAAIAGIVIVYVTGVPEAAAVAIIIQTILPSILGTSTSTTAKDPST